jgi:hypothetical protein
MALTKATFSMVAGAPVNVDDFIPTGTDTATTDCTAYIQSAIDAVAVTGGRTIVFSTKLYRIDSTVQVKANNTVIDGRGCELDYYGASVAFDFVPIGGVTYPVSCRISNVSIRVRTAASGTGFRIRASYSMFENLNVVLYVAATSARGIMLLGDETNGTGPYYNQFFNCTIQSQSLGLDHIGISFAASAPSYRAPNANTFYGGRVGQCQKGFVIKGNGNAFYNPTIENSALTGTAITFEGDTAVNCSQNQIFSSYIENANVAVSFTANANNNSVYSQFITGVSTRFLDLGTNNLLVNTNDPSVMPLGIKLNGSSSTDPNVLDYYEEGSWTPTLVGGTSPGSYTITSTSAKYVKVGRLVTVTGRLNITINSAGSGTLRFGGLPFAKNANEFLTGTVMVQNITVDATIKSLAATAFTSSLDSTFIIEGVRSTTSPLALTCADLFAGAYVEVSITYVAPS